MFNWWKILKFPLEHMFDEDVLNKTFDHDDIDDNDPGY